MKLRLSLLATIVCAGFSLTCHASDLSYTITGGTLSTSGSFSGSFLINSTNELIDGGSITAIAPTGGTTYSFFNATNDSSTPGAALFTNSGGNSFRLDLNGGLSSLAINTLASNGTGGDTALILNGGVQYNAIGAVITATPSATPEPSSLILIGTGALGLAGSFRRRFLNA